MSQAAERVRAYDGLYGFAVASLGEPTECEGMVTTEFDGAAFGVVRYGFASGVTFELETMPPSVSIVILRAPNGFEDAAAVVRAVREYASGRGLSIDWTAPERTSDETGVTEQFWDPDPGLNGSVSLTRAEGVLVTVRVSMAP
ncbi:MAG: hypothetical protein HKN72_16765 [Gemmatimonadetes bacterium]|nr:hypothetical protein [Gemmatimonadota bacterium]NNL31313.1 hypothetical protein [Gemmatimonadota bacterium]